ncbi:CPBP family intramembrane glutamic endopeptidase [Leucobacter iarius]|uniref:CAAX prenyl protease 2/Lysostaphin resistance protein A-like domain-containing protein n=1 Tax=Leucobacter iarius TaxID=333963 RepID=A0ABP4XHR0_9MICO
MSGTELPVFPEHPAGGLSGEAAAPASPGLPIEVRRGPSAVPWGSIAVFVAVSFGLAWLVCLPLWTMDPTTPAFPVLFSLLASATMFTPGIAVLAVRLLGAPGRRRERRLGAALEERGGFLRFLGMWPLRPAKRVVWFTVAALFLPILLTFVTAGVAAAFGWLRLDLVGFSAYADTVRASLPAQSPIEALPPIAVLVALQLLSMPFGALFNALLAFGEEVGWRGWLLPALRPLGTWPALLGSGAIWGLWHSPLILLGYNFGRTDWTGVAFMVLGCMAWGVFFGWLRLRSGSVWPAVVGHGALNAAAGTFMLLAASGAPLDPALVSPLGAAGWIVLGAVALGLGLSGQFRAQPELAPRRASGAPSPRDLPKPSAPPTPESAPSGTPSRAGTAQEQNRADTEREQPRADTEREQT